MPADDDGLSAMYELAEHANTSTARPETPRCPQCLSGMDESAVLCTNCGYDIRSGKSLATATTSKPAKKVLPYASPKKSNKPVDYMAPQGSLMAGVVMSAAFAIAASVLWVVVAMLTGRAFSIIAILIGWAAGVGMQVGHKGFSRSGGYASASMTLIAILLAKFAVIELLLSRQGFGRSILDVNSAKLGFYFFSPIGIIIMIIGMGAAFKAASGSVSN